MIWKAAKGEHLYVFGQRLTRRGHVTLFIASQRGTRGLDAVRELVWAAP